MKITIERGNIFEKDFNLLVLGIFELEDLTGIVKEIDEALDNQIFKILKSHEFEGKYKQTTILHTLEKIRINKIMLVGLGKKTSFNLEIIRQVSALVAKYARNISLSEFTIAYLEKFKDLSPASFIENAIIGSKLGLYEFLKYKTEDKEIKDNLKTMKLYINTDISNEEINRSISTAEIIADGVSIARDISNTPSNDSTPELISDKVRIICDNNRINYEMLDISEMEKLGMGGITSVAKGSKNLPKFLILKYNGGKEEKPIVIVGKGITFDSGGISLKPSDKMEEMKYDKSGAAAVIGIMQATAQLKLPLNVIGITPLTENLPSGSAYKPGDVLRIYNGKTVEIISTDAEGRLILADALSYATKYKPQAVIDLATLTGACIIALGNNVSGLLSNDDVLKRKLIEAGKKTDELVWELPLFDSYKEQIKSNIADMKNVGGRAAGTITAASFLSNFIDYPWAHIDIAGTAWTSEGPLEKSYNPKGATGIGVRLIIEAFRNWNSN